MRYFEVAGGINIYISEEEDFLVQKVKESSSIPHTKLNDREQLLAQRLVSRGVLNKMIIDEQSTYSVNSLNVAWRI